MLVHNLFREVSRLPGLVIGKRAFVYLDKSAPPFHAIPAPPAHVRRRTSIHRGPHGTAAGGNTPPRHTPARKPRAPRRGHARVPCKGARRDAGSRTTPRASRPRLPLLQWLLLPRRMTRGTAVGNAHGRHVL